MVKGESSQKSLKIDADIFNELEKWLETPEAKKHGFHSKAPFATSAIRELLEKYSKPRFEHTNFHGNVLRLIDNEEPKGTPFIEIFLKNLKLFCSNCASNNCEHIEYSWQDSKIKRQLIQSGVKNNHKK